MSAGRSLQGQEEEITLCVQSGFVQRNATVIMHSEIHRGENSERSLILQFYSVIETRLQLDKSFHSLDEGGEGGSYQGFERKDLQNWLRFLA